MDLYFNCGGHCWICVKNCYDWNDAVNRVKHWWDISSWPCINETDYRNLKEKYTVLTF